MVALVLYRPKMVVLVIVTPKNVGLGYYVGHMPHKFINQKPKKIEENQKKHRNQKKQQKKTIPWTKPLGMGHKIASNGGDMRLHHLEDHPRMDVSG